MGRSPTALPSTGAPRAAAATRRRLAGARQLATVLVLATLAAFGALRPAAALGQAPAILRVTGIPDESPEERERRFAPLGRYLEARLGVKVEYTVAPDYLSADEALAADRADLVWFTAYHYLQAKAAGKAKAFLQREEDERFRAVFITRSDSGIARLEDLRGRDFVFGANTSASGHLIPRWYLMQSGVDPRTDLTRFFYSGAHEATVNHVLAGRAVAGSLNSMTWKRMVEDQRVDTRKVSAFFETGRFNEYLWAIRSDLDADLVARLRQAMLALDPKNPEHAPILELQRATRYIEVRESDYEPHAAAARAAGLLK